MNRSRDELRAIVVYGCLLGLLVQLIGQTVFDATAGSTLSTVFGTTIVAMIGSAALDRFSEKRGPSDPPPPPSNSDNPPSRHPEQRREHSNIEYSVVVA